MTENNYQVGFTIKGYARNMYGDLLTDKQFWLVGHYSNDMAAYNGFVADLERDIVFYGEHNATQFGPYASGRYPYHDPIAERNMQVAGKGYPEARIEINHLSQAGRDCLTYGMVSR